MIAGATSNHALLSALLIAVAGAAANFLLGAAWGVCGDIAGDHAGVVSACMNTAGQIGGILSPIVYALLTPFGRSIPLCLVGLLYLGGAACWWFVEPDRPIFDEG